MLQEQHPLRARQPEVVPDKEPIGPTADPLGNQARAERSGLAGSAGSADGEDAVGSWPSGGPEPLVDLGPADTPSWPTVELAAASAIAWLAQSGEDGACVLTAPGGFAVHALDDGAWVGGFDASWLGDAKEVRATDPRIQAFVTGDGRVLPVTRSGHTTGLEAADVDAIDTVAGTGELDEDGLEALFVERVRARVLENLEENERFARDEVLPRYTADGSGMADLEEVLEELDALATLREEPLAILAGLAERRLSLEAAFSQDPSPETAASISALTRETQRHTTTLAALLAAQGRLLQQHPEATTFLDDQGVPDLQHLDEGGRVEVVTHVGQVLEAIDVARSGVISGDIDVLDLDVVVLPSIAELADQRFAAVARRVAEDHQTSQRTTDLVLAGLGLTALAVTIFCTGGLAAAVGLGAAALGAGQGLVNLEDALDKLLLAQTHLDPEQALAGESEAQEALFWAGLEAVLAGLDVAGSVRSVRALGKVRGAAGARASEATDLLADLQRTVGPEDLDDLAADLGVPVELDPSLGTGDVRVVFPGTEGGTRLRLGQGASVGDVRLHGPTIQLARRHEGLTGRLRRLGEDLAAWLRGVDPDAARGARELQAELAKVQLLQQARREVLSQQSLAEGLRETLQAEVRDLEVAALRLEVGLDEVKSGRGWVGQRGEWLGEVDGGFDPADWDETVDTIDADGLRVVTPRTAPTTAGRVLAGTPVDAVLDQLLREGKSLGQYLDMYTRYVDKGGRRRALEVLREAMGDVASRDWTVEALRRRVKAGLEPDVLDWLGKMPEDRGQRMLMATTDGINPADKGRLAEEFHAVRRLDDPAAQVRVGPAQLRGQAIALSKVERRLDFVQERGSMVLDERGRAELLRQGYPKELVDSLGDRLRFGRAEEVKAGRVLAEGDLVQIEDMVRMVANDPPAIVDGVKLQEAAVTFMDARAPRAKIDRLKRAMDKSRQRLTIEVYDSSGLLHRFGPDPSDLDRLAELM